MTSHRLTSPHQIHERFMRATNEKDVDGLLALYDTSGIAVQLDGSEAVGEPAMRAMLDGLTGAIQRIEGTTRKMFVSDDIALSSGSWTAEITLPDGSTVTQQGTTAEVSVRQPDGTWRIVIDDPLFA